MRRGEGAIGVFDSGVGGLSVVRELLAQAPGLRVLYVGDQAHVPYGGRPLEEVRSLAQGISRFLADEGCSAVVMACNISSATALECVSRALHPLPVFGMIGAAARACTATQTDRYAVLATEGTVRTGAYGEAIRRLRPDARVVEIPCPRLVPLVEAGDTCGAEAEAAALEYLRPAAEADAQTIVLGCTHYPFIRRTLEAAACALFDRAPLFVDPAHAVAREALEALGTVAREAYVTHDLLTTGSVARFAAQARLLLPDQAIRVPQAQWIEGSDGPRLTWPGESAGGTNAT